MTTKGIIGRLHMGLFILIVCGSFLISCRSVSVEVDRFCCVVNFSLEVVNNASDKIRIQIEMFDSPDAALQWHTLIGVDVPNSSRSGIFDLDSNERLRFLASSGIVDASDSPANFYVRSISSVSFYETGADIPYRGYVYLAFGCGVDLATCEEFDDDTLILHRSSDGTTENLFVESSDRPFYLERDKEDPALGRLVVTFVPSKD